MPNCTQCFFSFVEKSFDSQFDLNLTSRKGAQVTFSLFSATELHVVPLFRERRKATDVGN